jgi:flagellar basal-body rod modification protein FlgD
MAIGSTNGVGGSSDTKTVRADQAGFAGLTADNFMKLLLAQLQNQDPTQPVGNEELLNQLATMRNLQANIELGDAMKAITANQQLSTAATFIGKLVAGTDANQSPVSGLVDRAFLKDGAAYVGIGDQEVPLSNVSDVALA